MEKVFEFIFIISPLILAVYIFILKNINQEIKIGLWMICIFITFFNIYLLVRERKNREEKIKREQFYHRLYERSELWDRDLPETILELLKKDPLLAHCLREGQNYEKEYNFTKALEVYKKKLEDSLLSEEGKFVLYLLMGNSYLYLAEYNQAEYYFKASLRSFKKVGNKIAYLPGQSLSLRNLGMVYHNLGKPDEALQYYKQALKINRKLGYEKGIANIYNHMGIIYSELGKPEEGLKLQEEALGIFEKIEDQKNRAITLSNIGDLYALRGRTEEALGKYHLALTIFREIKYEVGTAAVINNIGLVYNKLGEFKQATHNFQESLKINERIGYKEGIVTNLGNLGLLNIVLGKSETSLEYYKKALEVIESIDFYPRKEILVKLINIIPSEKVEK